MVDDPEILAAMLFMSGADVLAWGLWLLCQQPYRGDWSRDRVEQRRYRGGRWVACCGVCGATLKDWTVERHVRERHLAAALQKHRKMHGHLDLQ